MTKRCLTRLFLAIVCGSIAQAQCVLDPIRVDRVEGYLIFGFQGKYRVLDKAEVRLQHPTANAQAVIASVSVDRDGHFEIADAKPGKYILSIRSEALIPASVDMEVTGPKSTGSKRLILAVLAADATKECGGASIKVQSKAEVDRVLSTAKRPVH